MSELREKVAEAIAGTVLRSESENWGGVADSAIAVIAQDRAERLAQRMPEIEKAIEQHIIKQNDRVRIQNDVTGHSYEAWEAAKARETAAYKRLLALIREVAG